MIAYLNQMGSLILSERVTQKEQILPFVDALLLFFQQGIALDRNEIDPAKTVVKAEEIGASKYLKALDKVLHTSGMQSVNIQNFAKALGVAPSTLYSTFKNKEDLFEQIGTIETDRLLTLVESKLDSSMDVSTLVETIMRVIDSYLKTQVPAAQYIDALSVSVTLRKNFETHPNLLRAYDALETICPGSGIFPVTLPACRIITQNDYPDWMTLETMITYVYHGINKENA